MRVLFVYSNILCGCTLKCCFELSEALKKFANVEVVYYKYLSQEIIDSNDVIIFQRLGANNVVISEEDRNNLFNYIEKNKDRRKFVYIIDDLLIEDQNGLPKRFAKNCNACLCSSHTLAKYLKRFNNNVYVFNTFIDVNTLDEYINEKNDKFTFVWASTGGLGIDIIRDIVDTRKTSNMDFQLIALGGWSHEFKDIEFVKTYPIVPFQELIKICKSAHVVLNPMTMTKRIIERVEKNCDNPIDFLHSKAEVKYTVAGISKACLITSPIDSYMRVMENGVDGIIVEDRSEKWIEKIIYAYENKDLIEAMALKAYEKVKSNYDISRQAENIYNIFLELIKQH